jgi:5-methyltetrahydropteroyltriglutamate--homocysteine methyltransferase
VAHPFPPKVSFDGGDLDCGSGLLLLIRRHIDPLAPGELLEVRSREISVREDLPAWCKLTGNQLVSTVEGVGERSFLVSKGAFRGPPAPAAAPAAARPVFEAGAPVTPTFAGALPAPAPAPAIPPLAVMGIGSWPRPRWLVRLLHDRLSGRLPDAEFEAAADDAVRLCVAAQQRAGVDVVTDGEQRRDSYASFVGARLDNCQLVPLTDLLPYVDHPDEFRAQLAQLDVPAESVRHPAVFGPLGRSRPLAVHELAFLGGLVGAGTPIKIALPGPYLLARTMWMECISDQAYASRAALADDIVRVLREEIAFLLAGGAALVQLDEPVLTEVVHGRPGSGGRSFMCGALGDKGAAADELAFAADLLGRATAGLPRDRLALHVCRGNWTPDESAALRGDWAPLVDFLAAAPVGALLLEMATPRAGDEAILDALPRDRRIGLGAIDQKQPRVETVDEIRARVAPRIARFGAERLLLVPDCGFATFSDNPITSAEVAEGKLHALAQAAALLRRSA